MPNSRQVENHCMRSTKLKLRANNTTLLLSSFQLHRHTDVTTAVTYISSVRGPHPFARCMPIVSTQGTVEVFERPTTEGQWWSTCWKVCRRFASRRRSGKKTLRTPAANKVQKFCNHGRPPGRPRNQWLDQLRNDSTRLIGDLWRCAVDRGHGGATTRRPSPAMRT